MKAPKKNLITAALLAAPAFASALGLGGINVKSGLNQPLLAEIPVTVASPAERDSLLVMLANSEDYARVGIDARGLSVPLEFAVAKDARGETIIRVTSKEAIREPFLQLLLQVNWNKGKLLREYSLLIDPPVMAPALRGSQAVSAPVKEAAPALPVEQMVKPAEPTPKPATPVATTTPQPKPAATPTPTPKPAPAAETEAPAAPGTVTTKSGDSAYVIANANKPSGTSTDQMMVAILRMNPQAFYQDNINALKTGQILRMPSADDLKQTSVAEASQLVREQNSLWRSMQAGASQQPVVVADSGAPTVSSGSSSSSSSPRLELLPPKSEDNSKALSAANAEASRAREELLSREREVSELRARVSELEKIKTDQERIVSFKDDQLAELTKQLEEARKQAANPPKVETTPTPTPVETTPVETTPDPVAETGTDTSAATAASTDTGTETTSTDAPDDIWGESGTDATDSASTDGATDTTAAADPSTDAGTDSGTDTGTETAMEPDPNAAPADGTTVSPVAEPTVSEPVNTDAATTEPVAEEKPWYMNPIVWGVGGVGVLGALALLLGRKKKPAPRKEMAPPNFAEDMNFGVPVVGASAAPAMGMGYAERDEDEARIQGAIAANPNDLWAHLDLLRLYYSRQDQANFEAAASTMFGFVVDQNSPQWQEAKTMGMQIIPGSPLFASVPDFGSMDDAPAFDSSQYDVPAPVQNNSHDDSLGSLDLGAFEDDRPAPAPVAPRSSDFGFDLDIDGPTKVMQPLQGDAVVAPPKPAAPVVPAKEEFNFDFNFDAPSAPPAKVEVSRSIDVAPTNMPSLDVGKIALDDVVPAPLENFGEISGDEFMIGDDAVATKLDLARAYLDMGDPDGARSMLEEVLGEGTDAQRNEAKQLLGRIA